MQRLWLNHKLAEEIAQHALKEHPREVCGIIGGTGATALMVVSVKNAANDPLHEYCFDERDYILAMRVIRKYNYSLLGFYHSHPNGDPVPSSTDIAQATYPHTPYLIVGLKNRKPQFAAWKMNYGQVARVELHITNQSPVTYDGSLSNAQITAIVISALLAFVFMLLLSVTLLPPAPPIP